LRCLLFISVIISCFAAQAKEHRIVALSPHLTEWVYSLREDQRLVGVSAYSDYPEAAKNKPVIADYQGVNLAALLQLKPTIVLAWKGGNKPQDIARIKALGIEVFSSKPQIPEDIADELIELGKRLGKESLANELAIPFKQRISTLRKKYVTERPKNVFYYSWHTPIMTIGKEAWGNKLLNVCGAQSAFHDSPIDYPTVSIQQVLLKQPEVILSVSDKSLSDVKTFWSGHNAFLNARFVVADPDILSRYTLRLAPELDTLCQNLARE